jgi:RNA polymerase sigma-70 factor (ECF subfamily)
MRASLFSYLSDLLCLSDEQVMLRIQRRNDPRAFAVLVRRWENWAKRFCARLTGDVHRGEDLAQEVFMRVFTHRDDYRHEARFATYLRRIAINVCCDEHRRVRRRREGSFGQGSNDESGYNTPLAARIAAPDILLARQERAEAVRKALLQLTERHRQVVILRHYEGLRFREIAELLEIPQGTVRSRMAEALTKLAQLLKPIVSEEASDPADRLSSNEPDRKEVL